jgi:hypothetical protein
LQARICPDLPLQLWFFFQQLTPMMEEAMAAARMADATRR